MPYLALCHIDEAPDGTVWEKTYEHWLNSLGRNWDGPLND